MSQHGFGCTGEPERELSGLPSPSLPPSTSPAPPLRPASALRAPRHSGGWNLWHLLISGGSQDGCKEGLMRLPAQVGSRLNVGSSSALQPDPGAVKSSFITGRVPATLPARRLSTATFPSASFPEDEDIFLVLFI